MKVTEDMQRVRNGELTDEIWTSAPIEFDDVFDAMVYVGGLAKSHQARGGDGRGRLLRTIAIHIEL